jgi:ribosomal protein S18 acetylase RimI-like enzyme
MAIVCRPARAQDLERANALVVGSMNDLAARHGFGSIGVVRPPNFAMFSLGDDPDGLWVVDGDAGQILGFAFSWICDDLWFLAQLFVSPEHQGHGIGRELLRRTLEHAQKMRVTKKALITFTFNSVSQGLYIRHGLFPRFPIYNFSVARESLMSRLQSAPLRCVPIENTASQLHSLSQIDIQALGVSREKHHKYLINDSVTRGVTVYEGNDCVGYIYIADGHIGQLAVTQASVLGPAFRTALNLAAAHGSEQVSAFLPGSSAAVLSIAVEHGMRITLPMVLMSSHDFGDWTRYLPRNPGFM